MDVKEYSEKALRTANGTKMRTYDDMILNSMLGMIGELGEVSDMIKKSQFQGHELDIHKLVLELGDVMWYVNLFIYAIGEYLDQARIDIIMMDVNSKTVFSEGTDVSKYVIYAANTLGFIANKVETNDINVHPAGVKTTTQRVYNLIAAIACIGHTYGYDIYDIMEMNIEKLEKRYGKDAEFTVEKSVNRVE